MRLAPERSWFENWWKRLRSAALLLAAASLVLFLFNREIAIFLACTAAVIGVYALLIRPYKGSN